VRCVFLGLLPISWSYSGFISCIKSKAPLALLLEIYMQQDMFIKIVGIDGEAQDALHINEIDVTHWEWKVEQNSNMLSGSGGGSGKATVRDLTFLHEFDKASPNLAKACWTGKHIPTATLTCRKSGGNPLDYITMIMSDVVITKIYPVSTGNGVLEEVSLSFSKIQCEYKLQNKIGGSAGVVTAVLDIKNNA
jgi:type VI secretion system secreted protein Hcp